MYLCVRQQLKRLSSYVAKNQSYKRGIYQTSDGKPVNADANGMLNILKKSSVVSLQGLYGRGEVEVVS